MEKEVDVLRNETEIKAKILNEEWIILNYYNRKVA